MQSWFVRNRLAATWNGAHRISIHFRGKLYDFGPDSWPVMSDSARKVPQAD